MAVVLAAPVLADESWVGGISDDWSDPANWQVGVPMSSDMVTVSDPANYNTLIGPGVSAQADYLRVGYNVGYLTPPGWSPSGLSGQLNIAGGGTLSTGAASISYQAGTGTVLVTGAGSQWTNAGDLQVGFAGTGILSLANGGTVSGDAVNVGYQTSASGDISMGGSGTTIIVANDLVVGLYGTGTMTVENGADANAGGVIVGNYFGSDGTVTVDGSGSTLTTNGTLSVGFAGTGALNVSNAATVTADKIDIGQQLTGSGDVLISGAGSSVTVSSYTWVGDFGTGTLGVTSGGQLSTSTLAVGDGADSDGTVNVDGTGSLLVASGYSYVGGDGVGTFNLTNSAGLQAYGIFAVGAHDGSTGTLTADNASLLTYNMEIGAWGQGGAYLTNGSSWTAGDSSTPVTVNIGEFATGIGGLSLAGASSLSIWGSATVGDAGTGQLIVNGGSTVGATSLLTIGSQADSEGLVTVNGAGSLLSFGDDITVGGAGSGMLLVANGGSVNEGTGSVFLGSQATGDGYVQIFGSGSTLNALNGSLEIGHLGEGTLFINNGGAAHANSGFVGRLTGSSGAVFVDGSGSSWTMTNDLIVGYSGAAGLTVTNGGVVTNGGALNTVGNLAGSTGTVLITGAGSLWQNTLGGLFIGDHGEGEVTVANGGSLSLATGIAIANYAGSSGTLNIGAAEGNAAAAAGSVIAGSLLFGAGAGTLVFNHTETAYTFASTLETLATAGEVRQLAGHTVLTGMSHLFEGAVTVEGGRLTVNGALGGGMVNVNGGTLGGSGTINGVTVYSGGTLAPGNSIGALTVTDFTFNAGSAYEVELNDGGFVAGTNNDMLGVTGTLTINGGTVHVTPENGVDDGSTYTPGTYTIIQAFSVNGAFDAVSDDFAFLSFALSYDPNNVYLTSTAATSFCLAGMSANQCAAGDGVFSVGSGGLFAAVLNLSDLEAPGALDLVSGEIHASAKSGLIEDSRFLREAALDRIRQAAAEKAAERGAGLWVNGFGAFGRIASDGNAAAMSRSVGGLFIGADGEALDNWDFGFLAGYSRSAFSVGDRNSSGSADSYHVGAYGGTEVNNLAIRFGGGYSWSDIAISRSVAFTGFTDSLTSTYRSGTGQLFGELAYKAKLSEAVFEPFANLAWVSHSANGFTEQGGAAALTIAGGATDAAFATLGLRAETELLLGSVSAQLKGMAGWRHAFGGMPTSTLAFTGGAPFSIAGAPAGRDALVLEAGLNVEIAPMATLGFNYSGLVGSSANDHSLKANLGIRF